MDYDYYLRYYDYLHIQAIINKVTHACARNNAAACVACAQCVRIIGRANPLPVFFIHFNEWVPLIPPPGLGKLHLRSELLIFSFFQFKIKIPTFMCCWASIQQVWKSIECVELEEWCNRRILIFLDIFFAFVSSFILFPLFYLTQNIVIEA